MTTASEFIRCLGTDTDWAGFLLFSNFDSISSNISEVNKYLGSQNSILKGIQY